MGRGQEAEHRDGRPPAGPLCMHWCAEVVLAHNEPPSGRAGGDAASGCDPQKQMSTGAALPGAGGDGNAGRGGGEGGRANRILPGRTLYGHLAVPCSLNGQLPDLFMAGELPLVAVTRDSQFNPNSGCCQHHSNEQSSLCKRPWRDLCAPPAAAAAAAPSRPRASALAQFCPAGGGVLQVLQQSRKESNSHSAGGGWISRGGGGAARSGTPAGKAAARRAPVSARCSRSIGSSPPTRRPAAAPCEGSGTQGQPPASTQLTGSLTHS